MRGFNGAATGCDGLPCGAASGVGGTGDLASSAGAGAEVLFPMDGQQPPALMPPPCQGSACTRWTRGLLIA